MFRFCLTAVAGLTLASAAPAATWAEAMFEDLNRDFGSVPRGPTLTHSYRFTNNTGHAVRITSVRVSCGCTTATALQGVVQPGQSSAIHAQMDTRRFTGPKTVTIYIQFDQPAWEEVRLAISANGRDDIGVSPDTLAFGPVPRGATPARQTTVSFTGGTQLVNVSADSNYVQLQAKQVQGNGYGINYEVTATLRPDTPVGKWFTDVWLNTNNPSSPRIRVPLTVDVEPALNFSLSTIAFGQVQPGQAVEKRVILRGSQPFRITAIEGTDETISAKVQTGDDKALPAHVIVVSINPNGPGAIQRRLKIITDLPGDNSAELPVTGTAAMPQLQ
jgi:hypothetical protein